MDIREQSLNSHVSGTVIAVVLARGHHKYCLWLPRSLGLCRINGSKNYRSDSDFGFFTPVQLSLVEFDANEIRFWLVLFTNHDQTISWQEWEFWGKWSLKPNNFADSFCSVLPSDNRNRKIGVVFLHFSLAFFLINHLAVSVTQDERDKDRNRI